MSADRKVYSGFTNKTAERLMLDAGAFFKNFNVTTDTYDTAVKANKLIGATRGGGKFEAKPSIRNIAVDGVKGNAKGMQNIDSWNVSIEANVLEITKDTLALSLTASNIDSSTNENYNIISAKNYIELGDYVENITYVGKISKGGKPIIIQIYNAINTQGLTLQTKDKDEAVISMKFEGTYDQESLDTPPFKIFYPKE